MKGNTQHLTTCWSRQGNTHSLPAALLILLWFNTWIVIDNTYYIKTVQISTRQKRWPTYTPSDDRVCQISKKQASRFYRRRQDSTACQTPNHIGMSVYNLLHQDPSPQSPSHQIYVHLWSNIKWSSMSFVGHMRLIFRQVDAEAKVTYLQRAETINNPRALRMRTLIVRHVRKQPWQAEVSIKLKLTGITLATHPKIISRNCSAITKHEQLT